MTTGVGDRYAVVIERHLSDRSYGAHIEMTPATDQAAARSEMMAIATGARPKLLKIKTGSHIVAFSDDQWGVITDPTLGTDVLSRISVVKVVGQHQA